ncbi:MAG: hypothetical protein Q4G27_10025 [Flavobacteriaceae bacterium]|nr:hypothetical protein [Flavobacteriaceae bacterium]
MKRFVVVFIFLSFWSCSTPNDTIKKFNTADFEIIKTFQQKWYGGQRNVSGTYYKVVLKQKSSYKIDFDSIYVENHKLVAIPEAENPFIIMATRTDPHNHSHELPQNIEENTDLDRNETHENAEFINMLVYRANGEKRYLKLGDFVHEDTQFHP